MLKHDRFNRRAIALSWTALIALVLTASGVHGQTPPGDPTVVPPIMPAGALLTDTDEDPGVLSIDELEPPNISWQVENPFRFFSDPKDTQVHREIWNSLEDGQRDFPVLSAERILSARFDDGWAAHMVANTCWNTQTNTHECPDEKDPYTAPTSHTVAVSLDNVPDASNVECVWRSTPIRDVSPKLSQTVEQPCDQPLKLVVPYPDGVTVDVTVGESRLDEKTIAVTDLFVVGVGDSFGSGEGNPDIPVRFSPERAFDYGGDAKEKSELQARLAGYPSRVGSWKNIGDSDFLKQNPRWTDQACHRSLYSHQLRAALQLSIEEPHRAVTFVGLACSGAETIAGLFLRYKGNEWVENPPQYSQVSAAARAQCGKYRAEPKDLPQAYHIKGVLKDLQGGLVLYKCPREKARNIDLLFVSIGGNDIGFARMLANAILADESTLRQLGGWMGQVHGLSEANFFMKSLDERFKALNRVFHNILHMPWNEADRIVLTAYPSMALRSDGKSVCPDGPAGMEVVPAFSLNAFRARESLKVAASLNKTMRTSAQRHKWSFVDEHRELFLGRGICAGETQNAVTTVDDLRLPRMVDGKWVPYDPSQYKPYASRQRWFRTPNDAFLTGNFHVASSIVEKVLKQKFVRMFQLLLASTYSGAFHPSAEGQAAIADAVVKKSRTILSKYGQGGLQP